MRLVCVLYLLCTRQLPFPGKIVMAVLASLATDTPSPPGDLNPAVPPALGELVMRLLAKKPEDRPTSAQAVVEAIKTVERELLAQRQTAALLGSAASMEKTGPAEVVRANSLESASPTRIAPGPRPGRRTWRISAAVLGIATAAAVGGFVLAPTPKKTRGLVADQPTAATGLAEDPSRVVTTQRTRDRDFVPANGGTDRLRSTEDRAVVAEKVATSVPALSPPPPMTGPEPLAAGPSQPPARPGPGPPPKPVNPPAKATPTRGDVRSALQPLDDPRRLLASEKNGSPAKRVNYPRLEIAADVQKGRVRPYVNYEFRRDGALAVSRGTKIEDGVTNLRLERRGDEFFAAFSADGSRWTSLPPISAKLDDQLIVGMVAINTASKPLIVKLEDFGVAAGPAVRGDEKSNVISH